jgi:membrane protease YdiL (CAAX protease family)
MLPEDLNQVNADDRQALETPPPPPPARCPFWGYSDLFVFIGLALAAIVLVSGIGGVLMYGRPGLRNGSGTLLLSLQLGLYLLFYGCFVLIFHVRYRAPVLRSLGWRRTRFPLAVGVVVGPALALFVSLIAWLLHTPKIETPFETMLNSRLAFALLTVTAVIAAPIMEELFFRGFLQPLLCRSFGILAGIAFTAAVFGAAHGAEYQWTWQYILAVGIVGLVFGWVREWSNSLLPSTIMHGCYNAFFVGALYFSKHGNF